jgi:hypothetical protein
VDVSVTSSDGHACTVIVQMGSRTFFPRTSLNQIADALRVPRDEIETILDTWTPDQLRTHLQQFPREVLGSRAHERRWEQFKHAS